MTECNQTQFAFQGHFTRQVTGRFDGGTMTSDAGGLLLRETDRRMNLLPRLAACFLDGRAPARVQHSVREMISQRVAALALGYEDLNDHEQLRQDPVLKLLAGQADMEQPLAGKSTLNRLELGTGINTRYKKITFWKHSIDELLVNVFVEAHTVAPLEIVLDIDTTDVALHGEQEARFFHGYYDHYCYLPLYIFAGEHLLCARLRPANIDGAAGSLDELQRIVAQLRIHWPETRIILRGDSGFCRDQLMDWCENNQVYYVLGFARNPRLQTMIADGLMQAQQQWDQTQKPARVFVEFPYQTVSGSWARSRRVVAKAEHIDGKQNPRFVVTSLAAADWPAQKLYEDLFCARGDMENRIKEQFMLFADRVSAASLRANQLRLYLSAMAYVLVCGLRRLGLQDTELATAQASTIRLRLLKIGALIRVTVRRVWISLPRSYPWQDLFQRVHQALSS